MSPSGAGGRMGKVRVVVAREFLSTVRRRSYLVVTFGMPFFAALYFGLVTLLPAFLAARGGAAARPAGVVDATGIIRWEAAAGGAGGDEVVRRARDLAGRFASGGRGARMAEALLEQVSAPVEFRSFATREEALEALRRGEVDRFYVVPPDYVETGAIDTWQAHDVAPGFGRARSRAALATLLRRSLMHERLDEARQQRVEEPLIDEAGETWVLAADGSVGAQNAGERVARLAIPLMFGVLLLMSLMTSAGYLLQGISEEKENRVIEVILSSVRPDQLLFGKLIGLGGAGLLQLAVWVTVTSLASSFVAAAMLAVLDARLFAACLLFFILGFLMIGSLMTGTGALGTSARESQQFAAVWSVLTVLPPLLSISAVLEHPNGWLARALGWFPLSAPITMMIRMAAGEIALWDIAVSILCLSAGVYLSLRAAGALFRLGLLLYGKRPTVREVMRQLRRA